MAWAPAGARGSIYQTIKPYYDKDITIPNLISQKLITKYVKFSRFMEYNGYMARNHFSKYGGPYFINEGISYHEEPTIRITLIGRIVAFFKSRAKYRNK